MSVTGLEPWKLFSLLIELIDSDLFFNQLTGRLFECGRRAFEATRGVHSRSSESIEWRTFVFLGSCR